MILSSHFTIDELTASETAARLGINNEPSEAIVFNLRLLAAGLELVRAALGNLPIHVNSGFRCAALNAAVGGSANSAHMRGLAADIICPRFGPPLAVCRAIVAAHIDTDQVIHEYGKWCHVGFAAPGTRARGSLLTIASSAAGYQPGLIPV